MATGDSISSANTSRRRCYNCKKRHVKCEYDGKDEKCKRCRTLNKSCTFKHQFCHYKPEAILSPPADKFTSQKLKSPNSSPELPSGTESLPNLTALAEFNTPQDESVIPTSITHPTISTDITSIIDLRSQNSHPLSPESTNLIIPQVHSPEVATYFKDESPESRETALLIRHFVQNLSKWFDLCDPEEHFRRVVPILALDCSILMKSICAHAAWHLSRLSCFDEKRSDELYQTSLEELIQAMSDPTIRQSDTALVATVILHSLEELREQSLTLESKGHLIGIRVFTDGTDFDPIPESSLRQAAFRVALREELHMGFINQQPLELPVELCQIDRTFSTADDDTWCMRMIVHCRDVLSYFLTGPGTLATWSSFVEYHRQWYLSKPDTFSPIFYKRANNNEGRHFPEMWFIHPCHAMGIIHYHLSRILLALSNPQIPKIGWRKVSAAAKINQEVQDSVIDICGIAMSNSSIPSAMIEASMTIQLCADRVMDPEVQIGLQNVLVQTRELHAYPTESAQRYLESLWHG